MIKDENKRATWLCQRDLPELDADEFRLARHIPLSCRCPPYRPLRRQRRRSLTPFHVVISALRPARPSWCRNIASSHLDCSSRPTSTPSSPCPLRKMPPYSPRRCPHRYSKACIRHSRLVGRETPSKPPCGRGTSSGSSSSGISTPNPRIKSGRLSGRDSETGGASDATLVGTRPCGAWIFSEGALVGGAGERRRNT